MHGFHNKCIENGYGDQAEMLLTDTDNVMYNIETENVYQNLSKDKKLFDFSNYSKDSKYYNGGNNLVAGKMKDETCGVPLKGFERLKSKMYPFITKQS